MSLWKRLTQILSIRRRILIAVSLALAYFLALYVLLPLGVLHSMVLVVVPVSVMAWFWGPLAGILAGLAGVTFNAVWITVVYGQKGWIEFLAAWPGSLVVLLAGYSMGLFREQVYEKTRLNLELDARNRFIETLGLLARDILASSALSERRQRLAEHVTHLLLADYVHLLWWNEQTGEMNLLASTHPAGECRRRFTLEERPDSPDMISLQPHQAVVIEDSISPRFLSLAGLTNIELSTGAELALPIVAGGYRFGAIVAGFGSPRLLSGDEVIFVQMTCVQGALALWALEQETQIQKHLREARTLLEIERALSETETVGLKTLLQRIVNSARELIPAAQEAVLHLVDAESGTLVPHAVAGKHLEFDTKPSLRLGEGIAGQVIATGESLYVPDVLADDRFVQRSVAVRYRSLLTSPIKKSSNQVLGTISIDSPIINAFNAEDERLLNALSVHAAIAIENARLLETTRQDLQEIRALHHIGSALAATLEPDELFQDTVNLLWELFGFYHVQIFVADPERKKLVVRAASGERASELLQSGYEIEIGAGIIGHVAEIGEPFVTNNVENVVFYIRHPLLSATQSEMALPIKATGQVFGVLDIQERPPRQFSRRQMQLMAAIADQLAVALQKATLYQELQTSLRQEQEMRAQLLRNERLILAGRLLASVSHELNNPLQAIQNALFLLREEERLSEQGKRDLAIILSETERMASLIGRLRATYRASQAEEFQPARINELIQDVHALTSTYMRHKNIRFVFHPAPDLPIVPAIPDKIRQVVLNLVMNAIEAMPGGGELTVSTAYLPEREQVLLTFADTGPGINPDIRDRIFEPFVTDKPAGTGLGLTITADIIRQHRGEIQAENLPERGAVFRVWLPCNHQGSSV
ncbi:MAG: GAF domain-containing protein [Anaerolineales bacterium]|nr:GAF domain-containing protein [Anaerolineales bacterium]MDW8278362.1 GAF domain-containing protein [Anaerolineales bacterium]